LEATCRFIRDRLGHYYVCLVRQVAIRSENQAPTSPQGVVALDPGVRTFQTCYDADGLVAEWGEADMERLFKDCYAADRLQKRIKETKGNSTKRYKRRMAWHRLLQRIRHKVDEVHKKLSAWLCENYRVVLLPKFETQNMMVRRRDRKRRGPCAPGPISDFASDSSTRPSSTPGAPSSSAMSSTLPRRAELAGESTRPLDPTRHFAAPPADTQPTGTSRRRATSFSGISPGRKSGLLEDPMLLGACPGETRGCRGLEGLQVL
jgi:transposase